MTAQELRVGNLLMADIGIVKVFSILGIHQRAYCESIDQQYVGDYSIDYLQPIPLSDDWLRRLGFVKPPSVKLLYKPIPQLKAEVHFEYFKGGLICVIYCSTGMFIPDDIKYVHQLQNLFFALTGEELKLKEE